MATKEDNKPTTKLPRTAWIIGLVSLCNDISSEMAYPLLPLFIKSLPGTTVVSLGLIEGIAEGTASIISGLSGWIADRFQRRKGLAQLGYLLTAIAKPVIALSGGVPTLILGRFLDRFGKGVRSAPKDTLLANVTTEETRGRIFGFERMMDSAGAVLGPALALLLVYYFRFSLPTVFLLAALPAFLAFLGISSVPDVQAATHTRRFTMQGLSSRFWLFLAINAIFNLGNSSNAFLLLKASEVGLGLSATLAVYMLYNAVYSLGSYPAGAISDRLGRKKVLLVGYAIFALVYCGFALVGSKLGILPLFIAYGIYPALTDGVGKALAVDTTTAESRATAIGLFATCDGLTKMFASYVGGWLWAHVNSAATFYYGAIMAAIAFVLLATIFPNKKTA